MEFHFDPTFSLLPKFGIGLRPVPTSEREIKLVSKYLGVDLAAVGMQENAQRLSNELEAQNDFLSKNLESDTIFRTDEYRRSMFVRDIVANHRQNRAKRPTPDPS